MIFASKKELFSAAALRMLLAAGLLLLPAIGNGQNEPPVEPAATTTPDQAEQAPTEIEIEVAAEATTDTAQTPADPLAESSPPPGQPASNSDDEKDALAVLSGVQPG
ncbi:MAG: hypothetical protein O6931_10330, partial [Gammaproteobacteria bacterium]|nr:hypothetical protein [Gammaproteobacteria bacterium]